jgi:hypothetical protein
MARNAWLRHVMAVKAKNKGMAFKNVLKMAKKSYRRVGGGIAATAEEIVDSGAQGGAGAVDELAQDGGEVAVEQGGGEGGEQEGGSEGPQEGGRRRRRRRTGGRRRKSRKSKRRRKSRKSKRRKSRKTKRKRRRRRRR